MRYDGTIRVVDARFQSAPGREAGRCIGAAGVSVTTFSFQSAPGREAGRCFIQSLN